MTNFLRSESSRSLRHFLTGAIAGFLLFATFSVSAKKLLPQTIEWQYQCATEQRLSQSDIFKKDCSQSSKMVVSYLATLSDGPTLFFLFIDFLDWELVAENAFIISSSISALLGGLCVAFLKLKKGVVAFLLIYFGTSMIDAFIGYLFWITG